MDALEINSDWRWMLDTNKTPYYPSMAFTEKQWGNWDEVFERIKKDIL